MTVSAVDRFLALVRREMRAADVRILDRGEGDMPEGALSAELPDGRRLLVTFDAPPEDGDVLARRLEMLAGTFSQSAGEARDRGSSRPPAVVSLRDELRALAQRCRSEGALVIDANSPVVWGSTSAEAPEAAKDAAGIPVAHASQWEVVRSLHGEEDADDDMPANDDAGLPPDVTTEASDASAELTELSRMAVMDVRGLPALATLHKGGHLRHVVRGDELGYVAHSFAGIYLLLVVFSAAFDELRAERAINDALPRIERLVLALPPLDPKPAPIAGVVALRGRRRR